MTGSPLAERIAGRLAVDLGPHTGRVAVKTFCWKALGRGPETLESADVPTLLEAMRPMLRTLLGRDRAEVVLTRIRNEARA